VREGSGKYRAAGPGWNQTYKGVAMRKSQHVLETHQANPATHHKEFGEERTDLEWYPFAALEIGLPQVLADWVLLRLGRSLIHAPSPQHPQHLAILLDSTAYFRDADVVGEGPEAIALPGDRNGNVGGPEDHRGTLLQQVE
jgi:hypothetical protein